MTVTLAPNVTVALSRQEDLADIKAGDFVASTSVKGTDGKNHSVELRIFPEAMRGAGRGTISLGPRPGEPDDQRHRVRRITGAPQGQTLKVTYKGGELELVVGPDTPIFGYGRGT